MLDSGSSDPGISILVVRFPQVVILEGPEDVESASESPAPVVKSRA